VALGAATLNAGVQDDILIGGWTNYHISSSGMTYDHKLVSLKAILAEWGSTDPYATRLAKLGTDPNTSTVPDSFVNGVAVGIRRMAGSLRASRCRSGRCDRPTSLLLTPELLVSRCST
jgi:hypothetical protein